MENIQEETNVSPKTTKPKRKIVRRKVVKNISQETEVNTANEENTPKKNKPSAKSGGFIQTLVSVILTAAIVGGGIYAWQNTNKEKSLEEIQKDARSARADLEGRLESLKDKLRGIETENESLKSVKEDLESKTSLLENAKKEFVSENPEFSFEYPAIYGEVKVDIAENENGKTLRGNFTENESLLLGAINIGNAEFSSTSPKSILNSIGFDFKARKYYFQTIEDGKVANYEVEPIRIVELEKGEIIIINKESFLTGTEEEIETFGMGDEVVAIVNLENKEFPGLVIINKDSEKLPLEKFEEILKSINNK